jgi:hypothetical protein
MRLKSAHDDLFDFRLESSSESMQSRTYSEAGDVKESHLLGPLLEKVCMCARVYPHRSSWKALRGDQIIGIAP